RGISMRQKIKVMFSLLVIIALLIPTHLVMAQSNQEILELTERVYELENFTEEEKDEIMTDLLRLHYQDDVSFEELNDLLEQIDNFDDLNDQLDLLLDDDIDDIDEDDMDDDDLDDDDDDMDDDDDDMDDEDDDYEDDMDDDDYDNDEDDYDDEDDEDDDYEDDDDDEDDD
ncbi:MAG: hypothetical protein ACQEQG_09845, partial [Bacillota bacterium]